MSIFDRFKPHKETTPREVVRAVVRHSEKTRKVNDEYHEAVAALLRRMDERKDKRHAEDY